MIITLTMTPAQTEMVALEMLNKGYLTEDDMRFWPRDPLEFHKRLGKAIANAYEAEKGIRSRLPDAPEGHRGVRGGERDHQGPRPFRNPETVRHDETNDN